MKKIYSRFRIGLMAFALGLASVYMAERFPRAPYVELPTAVSTNVFPVFIDKSTIFTREQNCGLDPADPKSRLDCTNERLFGKRDMSLYARYEVSCRVEGCSPNVILDKRRLIWHHWTEKTRAHVLVRYVGDDRNSIWHYFIEPSGDGTWQLTTTYERSIWLFVDGEETEVTYVDSRWSYNRPRWKIATRNDGAYDLALSTRYLQFENITGDTIAF